MKSVLLSIQPKYCELIASGKKTVEVRKTKPKLQTPFKVYIYCTKGETVYMPRDIFGNEALNGKVIGEFVCDDIKAFDVPYPAFRDEMDKTIIKKSCIGYYDLHRYAIHDCLFAWHISNLVIYDKPRELSEFRKPCIYGEESDVSCFLCEKSGYNHDMHIDCFNTVTRPPQSWCYVED